MYRIFPALTRQQFSYWRIRTYAFNSARALMVSSIGVSGLMLWA